MTHDFVQIDKILWCRACGVVKEGNSIFTRYIVPRTIAVMRSHGEAITATWASECRALHVIDPYETARNVVLIAEESGGWTNSPEVVALKAKLGMSTARS